MKPPRVQTVSTLFARLRMRLAAATLRRFIAIAAGQSMQVAGTFATLKLLARSIGPHGVGLIAVAGAVTVFLQQVLFGPLANAVWSESARNHASTPDGVRTIVRAAERLVASITLMCLGAYPLLQLVCDRLHSNVSAQLLLATLLSACSGGWLTILGSALAGADRRIEAAVVQGGEAIARALIVASAFAAGISGPVFAVICSLVSALLFVTIARTLLLGPNRRALPLGRDVNETAQALLRFAWPFAVWGPFSALQIASDRWSLERFGSLADVGLLAAANQIAYSSLVLCANVLSQLVGPPAIARVGELELTGRGSSNDALAGIRIATAALFGLGVIMSWICAAFETQIVSVFVDRSFAIPSGVLSMFAVAGSLAGATQLVAIELMAKKLHAKLVAPKVITATLAALLGLAAAWRAQLPGVALAAVLSNAGGFAWTASIAISARRRRA